MTLKQMRDSKGFVYTSNQNINNTLISQTSKFKSNTNLKNLN